MLNYTNFMDQQEGKSDKKHILVIEDEPSFRDILTKELLKEGYEVITAVDGIEGLEKMRKDRPDLILLDIVMPRKDGFSVLEEMMSEDELKDIPVVVLSNSGDIVELSRVKDLGAKEILIKTAFGPQELLGKVKPILYQDSPSPAPPSHENKASASEVAIPPESSTQGGKLGRILLIEDDPFLWGLIRTKLMKEGFDVTVAQDGEKGIEEARKANPSLVLLDIILPDVNGFTVLERLKADQATAGIPVVVLSNLGQQEDLSRAKALGAKDYLIKAHYAPQQIVDKIKEILGKK